MGGATVRQSCSHHGTRCAPPPPICPAQSTVRRRGRFEKDCLAFSRARPEPGRAGPGGTGQVLGEQGRSWRNRAGPGATGPGCGMAGLAWPGRDGRVGIAARDRPLAVRARKMANFVTPPLECSPALSRHRPRCKNEKTKEAGAKAARCCGEEGEDGGLHGLLQNEPGQAGQEKAPVHPLCVDMWGTHQTAGRHRTSTTAKMAKNGGKKRGLFRKAVLVACSKRRTRGGRGPVLRCVAGQSHS